MCRRTRHRSARPVRAHSSWSSFFDFLVAEDLVEGNPMAAIGKPRREAGAPRAIRDPDAAAAACGVSTWSDDVTITSTPQVLSAFASQLLPVTQGGGPQRRA